MTEYSDIFELLESVRTHKLRPRESLVPVNSVTGLVIGYATADGDSSVSWTMGLRQAKESATARGTKEVAHIIELLSSYVGRKQLLEELRSGALEYGIARPPGPVEAQPAGPVQCFIPGL